MIRKMDIRKRSNLGLGIFFRKNHFSQHFENILNYLYFENLRILMNSFSGNLVQSQKMVKNGQNWPKNGQKSSKAFFLKKTFLLFFHYISRSNSMQKIKKI